MRQNGNNPSKNSREKDRLVLKIFLVQNNILKKKKTPEEGAQTTIYCAVDETLTSKSRKYYSFVND